jgi:hypothetical protein
LIIYGFQASYRELTVEIGEVTASVVTRPTFEILIIGLDIGLKHIGDFFQGPDSVVGASWDTESTVDTSHRIDVEIGPSLNGVARDNTIDRTHFGAAATAVT